MSPAGSCPDDPFDTASLRAATLTAWAVSPTRLAEDAAVETDIAGIDYRDRLFTELCANAADAAVAANTTAEVAIWITGRDLHVANCGVPLSHSGIRALSAMRVSDKSGVGTVGRFGLGFHAVVTVCDEVELRSSNGGIRFDRAASVAELPIDIRSSIDEITDVPMLRLPWPARHAPAAGFDSEVVLTLRSDVDADDLLAQAYSLAPELLLELPALGTVTVGGVGFVRSDTELSPGLRAITINDEHWVQIDCPGAHWLVKGTLDSVKPLSRSHLCAPTRTDIELTTPAMCIALLPLTPDRRALHPDADVSRVAQGYAKALTYFAPDQRAVLVPRPGLLAGGVDQLVHQALHDELSTQAWVPTVAGRPVAGESAIVITDLTDALAVILGDLVADLADPAVSGRSDLAVLRWAGAVEWGLAQLCEQLQGVARSPQWWGELYDALNPLMIDNLAIAELGALPVPRTDGRMHIGVRGLVSVDAALPTTITWQSIVHPDAARPLLDRMGIEHADATAILSDPALKALIDGQFEDDEGDLARTVLDILTADATAAAPNWLGRLLLASEDGEPAPADEMLLPGGPLAGVLVDDAPFVAPAAELVDAYGADVLRRVGVGWEFAVLREEFPTEPDHDLPDEPQWWAELAEPPEELVAVRDLDLVAADRWSQALTMLAQNPATASLVTDRDGYTAWWIRHFAEIGATLLGEFRAPDNTDLAGVFDVFDHPHADVLGGVLAQLEPTNPFEATALLDRLADPDRDISAGVAARVHSALVRAYRAGRFGLDEVDAPAMVRTLAGSVTVEAMVVDKAWLLWALDDSECVTLVDRGPSDAQVLAEILDLPCASTKISARIVSAGVRQPVTSSAAVRFAQISGCAPISGFVVHDDLRIAVGTRILSVPLWVDAGGSTHVSESAVRA